MPLLKRAQKKLRNFNIPISYRTGAKNRLKDARNVYTNQDILETRNGISRWNATAFSAPPLSLSFFQDNSNNSYLLAKDSTTLYRAMATGAHTSLRTSLSSTTKHRGVAFNNRHIVAIESDGLFSYDGSTFTQLGQAAPTGLSAAKSSGGSLTDGDTYQAGVTFFDSDNGFETNAFESDQVAMDASNRTLSLTSIPTTADNANIDRVRIYLKNVTNNTEFLFITEINLGTASTTITSESTSTTTPPTKNAPPQSGGGKFLAVFGQRIAYAGNSTFPSDVFFSEPFLPDAFDDTSTSRTINVSGNGPITGLATGYFSDSNQTPYLAIFKRRYIELYTEISGSGQQIAVSNEVGCISHDTIKVINGDIYFMSARGWHVISNGKILRTKDKNNSIDNGDISDIFSRSGFTFELNKSNFSDFFSVYYPTLEMYMTFVSEGGNSNLYKSYNFEFDVGGFRAYEFDVFFNSGVLGEDSNGEAVVFLGGESGYIYTHSINEAVGTDIDRDGTSVAVDAFAQLYWMNGDDIESSYNYGPFILRALSQGNDVTVKYFLNYSQQEPVDLAYSFDDPDTGFILDVDRLDQAILSDGRTIVRYVGEILRSGQSLLIGIYKSQQGESISIIEGQLDVSKNGNPN